MTSLHDDLLSDLRTVRPAPARPAAPTPVVEVAPAPAQPVLQAWVTRDRWERPSFRMRRGSGFGVTVGAGPVRLEVQLP